MDYPSWHHHPPPPLQPPPPHNYLNTTPPPPFSQSHNYNNNPPPPPQYHHLFDSQSHIHNPPPPPTFQLLHHQHPTFHSHLNNPNISQSHIHNPPISQLHHHQNPPISQLHNHQNPPSFELLLHDHHHPSSFRLHDRNPPSFQSHVQDPPRFDLLDKSPSFRSPAATFSLQKPQIENNIISGDAYSPFDHHGYKRPRPDELGIKERMLKLIHDHGGNDSMSPNPEIRGSFHEDLHLKRPRFEESDVRNKYPMSNLNTHYKTNEFQDTRFAELLNQRGYEHKQGRNDLHPPNHDIRSNGYNILPTPLQVSPQNRTISENRSVFMDPKGPLFSDKLAPSLQEKPSSLFPISVGAAAPIASSYSPFSETRNSVQPYFRSHASKKNPPDKEKSRSHASKKNPPDKEKSRSHASNGITAQEFQPIGHRLSTDYPREGQRFPLIPSNKPKALDASRIFKQPHRATRPDHIVVILRGLPGSGKSYLAKMMRDLEVENGGIAPRIHSMDDYFMTEVEKVEESDNLKAKKPVVKMVMEYCYEAEMEEAYRSSMLKTFKKTLDEGAFPFVIVDDRNLRVADFAQFWAIAKRSGYEVYLLEATYKDPAGCAARNVHDFTLENIQKMADQWEEAPSMYLKLDAKSLLQGDVLKENTIQEVDMDTDDGESEDAQNGLAESYSNILTPAVENFLPSGLSKVVDSLNAESDHLREEVKELGRSKWSNDLEDDDGEKTEFSKGDNANALSAIIKSYKKEGKSVHWGDKAANTGFSIGAAKRVNTTLEIGPGSGYNSKSNPLPEELGSPGINGKSSMFQERIRAERESTQAVFDRRRTRIGGLDSDDE